MVTAMSAEFDEDHTCMEMEFDSDTECVDCDSSGNDFQGWKNYGTPEETHMVSGAVKVASMAGFNEFAAQHLEGGPNNGIGNGWTQAVVPHGNKFAKMSTAPPHCRKPERSSHGPQQTPSR